MDEMMMYEVYAKADDEHRVMSIDGGVTMCNVDTQTWVKIDEGTDPEKYGGCQQHYVGTTLFTEDGIAKYKLSGTEIMERTEDEIEADRAAKAALEEARREAEEDEKNAPLNELQEQIDDIILLMADMIGGE